MPTYRVPVELAWTGPGLPGVNVWHMRTALDSTVGDEQFTGGIAALRAFYTSLASNGGFVDTPYASGTTINLGLVTNVQTQTVKPATWATLTATTTIKDTSPALQICIGWRTNIAARRGAGRTFIGPLNTGAVDDDGGMRADRRTPVLTAATTLLNASLVDNGWAFGVYGLESSGGTPDSPHVLRDFTAVRIGTKLAVLRSRRD